MPLSSVIFLTVKINFLFRPGDGRRRGGGGAIAERERCHPEEGDPMVHLSQGRPTAARGRREQGEAHGRHQQLGRRVSQGRPGHTLRAHPGKALQCSHQVIESLVVVLLERA